MWTQAVGQNYTCRYHNVQVRTASDPILLEHLHLLAGMLCIMYTRLLISHYTGINHILVVVASSIRRI